MKSIPANVSHFANPKAYVQVYELQGVCKAADPADAIAQTAQNVRFVGRKCVSAENEPTHAVTSY